MFPEGADVSFFSTESSLVYSINASPYWAEAHVHFGRYNVVHITIVVASETEQPRKGTKFLESLIDGLSYELDPFFGLQARGVDLEVYLTVVYYGIRVAHGPVGWDADFRELASNTRELVEKKLG